MKLKINPQIGKVKYSVSYYSGKKVHKDGSSFFDLAIFKSKKELETFVKEMKGKGYKII